jgi:DNA-directed RNA polymerase subunit RPC12/RpoP
MSLSDDIINYELCFPGAVTGSTEVECPHCGELLTVPVDDPMGEESYQCCECGGVFDADWGEGTISHYPQAD